tara:strand:- start:204 stop:2093 length:1890 start_codon:yes stop_codon:yes gene_type:complete
MKKIAFTDFRTWTRDRFVDAQTRRSARLAPTYLIAHENGVEGGMHDALSAAKWSRVCFDLYSGAVKSAELLFYVNAYDGTRDTPMQVLVNGHALNHRQNREKMLTGGWDRKRINARYLQEGSNEFVFSHHGRLHYDPHQGGHADVRVSHSGRSFDGGKSWHGDALGPDRDTRGEYLVRLRVKGHPPKGLLTSPTVDVADPDGSGCIAPQMGLRRVDLAVQADTPAGTSIDFEMRSGSTPAFDPRAWTAWSTTMRLEWPGRFVQFRAVLRTDSSDVTPVLKGVTLGVESKEDAKSTAGMELVELDHPELAYSSYPFTYLAPHARLDRLRKQHRLDDVIAEGSTELEQLALLRDWVHSQWLGWQSQKYSYCPPWDPLEILETTKGDWGFGMCTHYGATFAGCASALGWVARVLIVDHHCLAEVWSEQLQKWILEDAGPCREYDATYEIDGVPINALELHDSLLAGQRDKIMSNKLPQNKVDPMDRYVETFCRFGIPLRNNHLTHAEPAELRHGNLQYHYNGYLWWSDQIDPTYSEYSLQTTRPADFYWSINQTRIYLQASDHSGVLHVLLEHTMPNFSHFSVQVDGAEWQELREVEMEWKLQLGPNRLAVRAVNVFGREGRTSHAEIACER